MQSASDTPSSHLWAQSRPADRRGVGCGWDRRANPGTKAVALRESRRRGIDPPGITSADATLRHDPKPSAQRDAVARVARVVVSGFPHHVTHTRGRKIKEIQASLRLRRVNRESR